MIVVRICYTAPDEQKRRRSFCSTPRGRIERRRSSRGLRGCTARRCDRAFQRWKIAGAKQGSLSLLSSWGFRRYYCCFPRFLFPFPIILLLLRNRSFALIIVLPLPTVGDVSSHLSFSQKFARYSEQFSICRRNSGKRKKVGSHSKQGWQLLLLPQRESQCFSLLRPLLVPRWTRSSMDRQSCCPHHLHRHRLLLLLVLERSSFPSVT